MADHYPAKLLLFGEYTVLNGSQALAVPLNRWKGKWIKEDSNQSPITEYRLPITEYRLPITDYRLPITDYLKYFNWLLESNLIDDAIYSRIVSDVEEGWMYSSDIPMGYGVGSSGAFVAAVFDRYVKEVQNLDFKETTRTLASMESFFHGSSSGMDPLVSYTNKAIHRDDAGIFHPMEDPGWPEGYKIYLLDSGKSRQTAPLVQAYKDQLPDNIFAEKIDNQLIPAVEQAIHYYLTGESKMLEECIAVISHFQREYFSTMIPEDVKKQWDELMLLPGVYVKFCGAGGGGYFLVICTKENFHLMPSLKEIGVISL